MGLFPVFERCQFESRIGSRDLPPRRSRGGVSEFSPSQHDSENRTTIVCHDSDRFTDSIWIQ